MQISSKIYVLHAIFLHFLKLDENFYYNVPFSYFFNNLKILSIKFEKNVPYLWLTHLIDSDEISYN